MIGPVTGCGCGSGPALAAPVQQGAAAAAATSAMPYVPTAGDMGSHGHSVAAGTGGIDDGPGVRDASLAEQWRQYLWSQVSRFASLSDAQAAGYHRNPSSGSDPLQHYIHDGVFKAGDAGNFAWPATLMYRHNADGTATLAGVMISARPGTQRPDFGAGAWHRHPGDDYAHMHVWFDKGVHQGAFENNTGVI